MAENEQTQVNTTEYETCDDCGAVHSIYDEHEANNCVDVMRETVARLTAELKKSEAYNRFLVASDSNATAVALRNIADMHKARDGEGATSLCLRSAAGLVLDQEREIKKLQAALSLQNTLKHEALFQAELEAERATKAEAEAATLRFRTRRFLGWRVSNTPVQERIEGLVYEAYMSLREALYLAERTEEAYDEGLIELLENPLEELWVLLTPEQQRLVNNIVLQEMKADIRASKELEEVEGPGSGGT